MRVFVFLSIIVFSYGLVSAQTPALSADHSTDSTTIPDSNSLTATMPSTKESTDTVKTATLNKSVIIPDSSTSNSPPTDTAPAAKPTLATKTDSTIFLSPDSNTVENLTASGDSVAQQKKSAVIEEIEEDLILDGGEESILAPAAVDALVQPFPVTTDSSLQQKSATTDSSIVSPDSIQEQQKQMLSHYPAAAMPKITDKSQPLIIEKTESINFAKNFKEYRSPKIAILLSLLVPGAGQAYSHHKLKTGIFGFIEVGFIAAGAIVGIQGNKHLKNARSFADDHYSTDSLANYYAPLKVKEPGIDTLVFLSYIDYNDFKKEASDKSQNYYNYISHHVSPYIQGWDDVTPRFDGNFDPINPSDSGMYIVNEDSVYLVYYVNSQGDTSDAQYGFSRNQNLFNKKLSKANSYFRWSKSLFTMLLINHIVSAIDAGITAKAYNDKLLGKSSFWQKVNLKESVVSTPIGPAQGFSLEVRF